MRAPNRRVVTAASLMAVALTLVVGCSSTQATTPTGGLGAGAPADGSASQEVAVPTTANPDTVVLRSMAAAPNTSVEDPVRLRGGTIVVEVAPVDASMVTASAAMTEARLQGYAPEGTSMTCRSGVLTDTDIFQPEGPTKKLLYDHVEVWMCITLDVPTAANSGAVQSSNVVTFIDARNGKEMFTIQDGA